MRYLFTTLNVKFKANIYTIEKELTPEVNGTNLSQSKDLHNNTKWIFIYVLFK